MAVIASLITPELTSTNERVLVWVKAFNVTYNNISAVSWRSVLLVEETGVRGENHRLAATHWQTKGECDKPYCHYTHTLLYPKVVCPQSHDLRKVILNGTSRVRAGLKPINGTSRVRAGLKPINGTSRVRAGLKPIGLIAPNWTRRLKGPLWGYLLFTVQVHTTLNTLQVLQRTTLGPTPP